MQYFSCVKHRVWPYYVLHKGETRASNGQGREPVPWVDDERATPAQSEMLWGRVARF